MFSLNITNIIETIQTKKKAKKYFGLFYNSKTRNYEPPTPEEIRKSIAKLSECPKCHFIVFNNYWGNEIEKASARLCPTCGNKI